MSVESRWVCESGGRAEIEDSDQKSANLLAVSHVCWWRRIPVRLRVSRRAALAALVGSGWENYRSWVAHMYIIPAQGILSF